MWSFDEFWIDIWIWKRKMWRYWNKQDVEKNSWWNINRTFGLYTDLSTHGNVSTFNSTNDWTLTNNQIICFCRTSLAGFRKIVDLNRNYCLILGLALFLFVVDIPEVVEIDILCDSLTLLTHYIWLSVFAWTVLEGYLLFKALVVVWDTGEKKILPLYVFGYGFPAFISILTLIIIVITERGQEKTSYHHPEYCWLGP